MTVEIITFRSGYPYFSEEESDLKNNTVREIDIDDERFLRLLAYKYRGWIEGELKIEIRENGSERFFQRNIQHISVWGGLMVITWKPLSGVNWIVSQFDSVKYLTDDEFEQLQGLIKKVELLRSMEKK